MTYFMTQKVTVTICCQFDLVYDQKRHRVIRGRRNRLYDRLYDPKGHVNFLWSV